MINSKEIYANLLSDERIKTVVDENNILNAYPASVENFPCIVFIDENQSDGEYADNKHTADNCSVTIHIFSKKLDEYVTTSEIGVIIANVLNEDLWHCSMNREITDPNPDVEHRVMDFSKSIYNELNIN